jgi:hypothetical protein
MDFVLALRFEPTGTGQEVGEKCIRASQGTLDIRDVVFTQQFGGKGRMVNG